MAKSKPLFPPTAIVEVLWDDAYGRGGWDDLPTYLSMGVAHCRTTGYLLKRDKTSVMIGLSQCEDGNINSAIVIPIEWVRKIKVLRKA